MRTIDELFADYAAYHTTGGNKACHRIGIPLIMFSLIGMLQYLTLITIGGVRLDAAILLIAASSAYYYMLEWRLATVMLLASLGFYLVAVWVPFAGHVVLFVAGWILQFVGHGVYEKRSPAFARNLIHLLVGPLWIANDLVPVSEVAPTR